MKKILVVDDSETIRQQVSRALEAAGFGVVEAGDGLEGLERVADGNVSLVILDVNMPLLNGIDMLERMKQDPKTKDVPVLMLTTEVHRAMIQRARDAGASGWVIKPVKMEHLVETVTRLAN